MSTMDNLADSSNLGAALWAQEKQHQLMTLIGMIVHTVQQIKEKG